MHARKILVTTLAATAALVLAAPEAQAATRERFDRSAFDRAPVVTSTGYSMAGDTAGELGGHLSMSIQVKDGTLPTWGECEPASVQAVLTVSPGESFAIDTTGELCSHFIDGTPTVNAYFGNKQVEYTGSHKHARVTDGMIAFKHSWLGGQGSVGLSVRW
jgi:hypothetical protein